MSQNTKDVQQLKRQFLEYLEIEKGRSLKTIANYDHYISRFIHQTNIKNIQDITEDRVRTFRLWLNRQNSKFSHENLKKNTQNYYIIALRVFLKYLHNILPESVAREILATNRLELAKTGQRELDLITPNELQRLLEASMDNLRNNAILELLFSTGLRVSELCDLKIDSIDLSSESFSIRGKGDQIRVVFLSDNAKSALRAYLLKGELARLNDNSSGSFFGVTPRTVQRLIKYYAIKAGITKKVTPHGMRHLFATDLLSNGADLRSVQALLGHANITTTQIYTHVTDRQLGDVHKTFHAKSLGKRK